jgi:putative phosphoribosyl transferase
MQLFRDRDHAGQVLAEKLVQYRGRPDVVVLGLPRGGIPVAFQVSQFLLAPLDVFIVRKIGVPGHEELALGAIASGGGIALNHDVLAASRLGRKGLEALIKDEERELVRREILYRGDRLPLDVRDKIAILVDDGLATGASMKAAISALRKYSPQKIVVAVPVSAPETCDELSRLIDEIICAFMPDPFFAVGIWYDDFSQTSDEEVKELLERAAAVHHE